MEWHLACHNQQEALRQVLLVTDVPHILVGLNFNPLVIEHEVETGEVAVAFRDDMALEYFIVIATNVVENLLDEVVKVEGREVDCRGACIKDGVELIVILLIVFNLCIGIRIRRRRVSYCNALIISRPVEVVEHPDVPYIACAAHGRGLKRTKIDIRIPLRREVEGEGPLIDNILIQQSIDVKRT